ncbi:ferrochelatase-2, chloroplastic-like [Camellia sinensis]|uniref:ferrochelatase-2, chloroplastic-like n=1 Tax=Camellia sinensis TaxID=4442 RepID=UPI00103650CC|nr:ferrochelatase-2, chloroplastic-like [Camellia sinensis]
MRKTFSNSSNKPPIAKKRQQTKNRKTPGSCCSTCCSTCCSLGALTYLGTGSAIESPSHGTEERVGVLLLNLGGPETIHDVQPFLFNLFADPFITSLGVALKILVIALRNALEAKEMPVNVYVAMQYWHPFTVFPSKSAGKDRITKLIVLPLYPQFSISTTGSSIRVLQTIFREDAYLSRMPISIIQSWCQREGYIKSMADLIEKELESFSTPKEVMIFISAHGVPVSYVEDAGDPYRDQMEECIHLIMQGLKSRRINNDHTLAYQSHVGPVQWLKPYTDEVLVERGKKGVKSLLAVPVSFVGEHIKTLEEIDMECKHLALESGIENWGRVCALGCTSSFITDMADVVIEVLPSATAMTTSSTNSEESDYDPVGYAIKMFFGSILAFVLLLSPKMIMAFRNHVL